MKAHQLIALLLWRGGLLLAGGFTLVLGIRFGLNFIDVPDQVLIGLACCLAGLVLLMASLVTERVIDARAEREAR